MPDVEPGAPEPAAIDRMINLIDELHEGRHRLTPTQMRAGIILLHDEATRIADQEQNGARP
ncbi:hypothetical protein [Arthrobacter sp. A2-55]|uniref:hypothetical protein n=1 Tax=Arthrobacter sp. A2-55 TaxID=2897337 RepID=UPI0021CD5B49|nr:hypothetical protein [Arthrobacter sp. A2-55]MCU6480530.1 hypothetical protein [Arthrobacter sp. A2-55]